MKLRILWCCMVLSGVCGSAPAAELRGRCVQVVDGDTLLLAVEGGQLTVDLNALDAPELGQPFGEEARAGLEQLVLDQDLTLRVVESLSEIHVRARVRRGDVDVNKRLIEEGLAWHDTLHDSQEPLVIAQIMARSSALGLWSGDEPQAPWEWREQRVVATPTPKPHRLEEMAAQVALKKNEHGKAVILQPTPSADDADGRPGGASGKNPYATGATCCCKLIEVTKKGDDAEEKTIFEETETYACEHAVAIMNTQTGEAKIPKFCVRWVYCEIN